MTAVVLIARNALAARRGDPRFAVGLFAAAIGAAHLFQIAWPAVAAAALAFTSGVILPADGGEIAPASPCAGLARTAALLAGFAAMLFPDTPPL
jgi:hypothetical protein